MTEAAQIEVINSLGGAKSEVGVSVPFATMHCVAVIHGFISPEALFLPLASRALHSLSTSWDVLS